MRGVNKYIMVFLSGLFAIGAIVLGMKYSGSRIPEELTSNSSSSSVVVDQKKKLSVADLFLDENQVFLAKNMSDELIESVKEQINEEDTASFNVLSKAVQKWKIQKQLNSLYTKPALSGDQVNQTLTFAEGVTDLSKQQVLVMLTDSGIVDGFGTQIKSILSQDSGSGLDPNTVGDTAEVTVARERLSAVIESGQIVPGFTLEGYEVARDAISVLPEDATKMELVQQLKIVEAAMTQMGSVFTGIDELY